MNPDQLKVGINVLIEKINITHKRHDSNAEMRSMVGRIYKISEIRATYQPDHEVSVFIKSPRLRGYIWAPEDLKIPIDKNIKGGKFDPNNLIINKI